MATPRKSSFELSELFRKGVGTGRPPHFKTVQEFIDKVQEYFDICNNEDEPPTITALTLFCGFSDRASFYDYENIDKKKDSTGDPEFSHVTRAARTVIANWHEFRLCKDNEYQGANINISGSTYMLNNLGFSDSKTIKHEGNLPDQVFKIGDTILTF